MNELVNRLLEAVWGIWRYRWQALALAWVIALVGWFVVIKIDHRYFSYARVYVDTNEVLEPLMNGIAVQNDVHQRVAQLSRTILSRPNLNKLIDNTALANELSPNLTREALLNQLEKEIALYDASGSRSLYSVGFAHSDPVVARDVVNAVIELFIATVLGGEREDSDSALVFLDQRIGEYEARLEQAEERLSRFKRDNAGVTPGESGGYYQRLNSAGQQQRKASLELREAVNRRDELKRQLSSEAPAILNGQSAELDSEQLKMAELQVELDELLLRYTERHPRINQLRNTIEALEQQRLEGRSQSGNAQTNRKAGLQRSVVYQSMRTLLAEAEARVAELSVRDREYRLQVEQLERTIDSIPLVEAKLVKLDRDYETVKQQHEQLLQRRELARLTSQVEQDNGDVRFELIDPPVVATTPNVPDKRLLSLVVMAIAGVAGLGLGFVLSLLNPVFYNPRALATVTDRPVVGSISLVSSARMRWASAGGLILFALGTLLLLCVFSGVMYMQFQFLSPAQLLDQVLAQQDNLALYELMQGTMAGVTR